MISSYPTCVAQDTYKPDTIPSGWVEDFTCVYCGKDEVFIEPEITDFGYVARYKCDNCKHYQDLEEAK